MNKIPNFINIKKIKPCFNNIIITAEKYKTNKVSNGGLIVDATKVEGSIKEYQIVLSVGSSVRNCKEGDLIKINPSRYAIYKQKRKPNSMAEDMVEHYNKELVGFNFNLIEIDGENTIMLSDVDVDYVIEEYESLDSPEILIDNKTIITQ